MSDMSCCYENLRMCHVNCQSLIAHFDEFNHFFADSGYHIICMSETWLKPATTDGMVKMAGYSLFRCDRTGRQPGGVAFYLKDTLKTVILKQSITEDGCRKPEYLIAEINSNDTYNLLLAEVYRPPNCGYLQDFENLFLDLQVNYRHSIIIGDFNTDMEQNTYDIMQLVVLSAGMFLIPYEPTHHLRDSRSVHNR